MDKVIIYVEDGTLNVINPNPNSIWSVDQIAKKDTPTGLPYKILNKSDLPDDYTFRTAWEIDEKYLNDGLGS